MPIVPPPPGWPNHGGIEFNNVTLSYGDPEEIRPGGETQEIHPGGDPEESHPGGVSGPKAALDRVSFSVEAGSRVVTET